MNIQVGSIFKRLQSVTDEHKVVFLRGGARSGKSFAIMQIAVIWLYTGHILGKYIPEGNFTIIRATFPALRASVMRDLVEYLFELDIYKHIEHRKTIHEFHYQRRHIDFIPADNEQKLRGKKHSFVWLEEINDLHYAIFIQTILRTTHKMFMTVNPSGEPWGKTEIEDKRMKTVNDVFLDVSTFRDNPFLEQSIIDEITKLEFLDADLYRIYNLGLWTKLKGLIYPDCELIKSMPNMRILANSKSTFKEEVFGLDFGFTHPTAFIRCIRFEDTLYIDELIYESELLIDEIAERIKEHKPRKVYCDSAEPRSIHELKKRGVRASPARKGKDSVKQGINFVKQHKLKITERSIGLIEEIKRYKWHEDLNGKLTEQPIKEFDDSADALRYSLNRSLGSKMSI